MEKFGVRRVLMVFLIITLSGGAIFYYFMDKPFMRSVEEYTDLYLERNPSCKYSREEIIEEANRLIEELEKVGIKDPYSGELIHPNTWKRVKNHPAMGTRLTKVKDAKGNVFIDLNGDACWLRHPLANSVSRENKVLYKDSKGKEQFQITYCYRSKEIQAVLHAALRSLPKKNGRRGTPCAKPGRSFHNIGMAFDARNYATVMVYIINGKSGILGGCIGIEEDFVHFSMGEISAKKWSSLGCALKQAEAEATKYGRKAINWVSETVDEAIEGVMFIWDNLPNL